MHVQLIAVMLIVENVNILQKYVMIKMHVLLILVINKLENVYLLKQLYVTITTFVLKIHVIQELEDVDLLIFLRNSLEVLINVLMQFVTQFKELLLLLLFVNLIMINV